MSAKQQTSKGNRFLKGLWLIPILVLGYFGYMNLLPFGGTLTYHIDVGGEDTAGLAKLTGPFDRISDKMMMDGNSFRQLEKDAVYFELDDRRLGIADEVEVSVSFRDNFPGDGKFILGARGKEESSYYWKDIYVPFYGQLSDLPLVAENGKIKVYATGEGASATFRSVDEFRQNPPLGSVVVRNDAGLSINQRVSPEELSEVGLGEIANEDTSLISLAGDVNQNGRLETDTSLRIGPQTFYFFATSSTVELQITKRDLNGYEGGDMLAVLIYSLDGTLKALNTIPDDGDITGSKKLGDPQYLTLKVDNLERGTYRLVLKPIGKGNDLVITHLRLNQAKLVMAGNTILAGNLYLGGEPEPMTMWGYLFNEGEIKFLAWHNSAIQNVTVSGEDYHKTLNRDTLNEWFTTGLLKPGIYQIIADKGDIRIVASKGYLAFTEDSVFLPISSLNREEKGNLVINTALRDAHTFWTYITNGSLKLEVTKQDWNQYEGSDELNIEVYSLDGKLVGSAIIPDDGDETTGKQRGSLQAGNLLISGLKPGAYRIEFKCGGDLLVREIKINQQGFVSKRLNVIGMNPGFFDNPLSFDPVSLYFKDFRGNEIQFFTAHNNGLQNINISGNGSEREIKINEANEWFSITLEPGAYQLTLPKQDIVIESNNYFSFTPDSFFLPKRCEVVDLKYDLSWVKENANYLIIDYEDYAPPVEDNGWMVAQMRWGREDIFIEKNKLEFQFSVPHLSQTGNEEKAIPIDWIEIKLKILPLWERLGW